MFNAKINTMETIKITHYLNGNLYEDDFCDAISEYDNPNTAFYVLATDKDVAEDTIFEGGNWIKDLAVKEVINYIPKQALSLRLSDGSIYKETISN